MTVRIGALIHVEVGDISHRFRPGPAGYGTLDIDAPGGTYAHLFFDDTAAIDAAMTHLAELKSEMTGAPAQVITDSERTCDARNPLTGEWCNRSGSHGVHRDADGAEWTS